MSRHVMPPPPRGPSPDYPPREHIEAHSHTSRESALEYDPQWDDGQERGPRGFIDRSSWDSNGDISRETPLHKAAKSGALNQVLSLLQRKPAHIEARTLWGQTPLHNAAEKGHLNTVEALVKSGADKEAPMHTGATPLYIAAENGHTRVVEALLINKADAETKTHKSKTPLHIAAENGHIAVVEALLKGGADKEAPGYSGVTPLHIAAEHGHTEVVVALLINKADIEAKTHSNQTPLHMAAQSGSFEVVKTLLRNGAYVMARDSHGERALESALGSQITGRVTNEEQDDTALVLLQSMTEEQALEESKGSRLPLLWEVCAEKCVKCLRWILRYSTKNKLLAEAREGRTLLYVTISAGREYSEVAMLLLQHSAPIQGTSHTKDTALHYAAKAGMSDVVENLLHDDGFSHKPRMSDALNMRNEQGHRPLECSCAFYKPGRHASERTVILLLRQDCLSDIISDVDEGWTALHWAVFYNRLDLIGLLVSKGADLQARDYSQRTPIDLAKSAVRNGKRSEIMQCLWPENTKVKGRESGAVFPLTRPRVNPEIELSLDHIPSYIVDMYRGGSMETSGFSMHSLLYAFGPNYVMKVVENMAGEELISIKDWFALRWIHLPANNKVWIQSLAQSIYFDQHIKELDKLDQDIKELNELEQYLKELDEIDQEEPYDEHPGLNGRGNRFYHSVYRNQPGNYKNGPTSAEVLFGNVDKFIEDNMAKVTGSAGSHFLHPFFNYIRSSSKVSTGPTGGTQARPTGGTRTRGSIARHMPDSRSMALSMPFLCFRKFGLLTDDNSTRNSLQQHYTKDKAMHLPLTLDEFYYDARSKSAHRGAKEQVLFRHQGRGDNHIAEDDRLVCMVDQLWIHVLDYQTIVTSCTNNWDDTARSTTIDVQEILRCQLLDGKEKRPPLLSHFGMIPLAIATCIRDSMFFDQKRGDNLLEVFREAIARAADEEVDMFTSFMKSLDSHRSDSSFTREARDHDVTGALQLLNEVKDIVDELKIIRTVLLAQERVMKEAFQLLRSLSEDSRGKEEPSMEDSLFDYIPELIDHYESYSRVYNMFRDVDKLIENAGEVADNINRLLDLRQKHANLTEAMWARQASEDTTRQGRTIMVFTVVTIIFLPITFLSSLFALDVTAFPHNDEGDLSYTPRWAFSWLIGMTIAVSLPLILVAFFVNDIGDFISRLKSRKPIQDAPAREKREGANQTTLVNDKGKIPKKEQSGWKSLLRKRPIRQGGLPNV